MWYPRASLWRGKHKEIVGNWSLRDLLGQIKDGEHRVWSSPNSEHAGYPRAGNWQAVTSFKITGSTRPKIVRNDQCFNAGETYFSHFSEGWRVGLNQQCRYSHLSRFVVESCSGTQAIGRAHRMDRNKMLKFTMITRGTIEEKSRTASFKKTLGLNDFRRNGNTI